jgi:hypothetical protein
MVFIFLKLFRKKKLTEELLYENQMCFMKLADKIDVLNSFHLKV